MRRVILLLAAIALLWPATSVSAQDQTVIVRCYVTRQSAWEINPTGCVERFAEFLARPTEFWTGGDRPDWTRQRFADADMIVYVLRRGYLMRFYLWQIENGHVVGYARITGAGREWGVWGLMKAKAAEKLPRLTGDLVYA